MPAADPAALRLAWVKFCLAQRGHSMTAAAERAGVTLATVSRVVSGSRGAGETDAQGSVWRALEQLTRRKRAELEAPPTA